MGTRLTLVCDRCGREGPYKSVAGPWDPSSDALRADAKRFGWSRGNRESVDTSVPELGRVVTYTLIDLCPACSLAMQP